MHVVARFLPIISLLTYKGKGDDDDGAGVTQVGSVSDVLGIVWYQLSSVVGSYNADLLTYRLAQEWGQLDGANNHVWHRATVERLVDEDHLANIKKVYTSFLTNIQKKEMSFQDTQDLVFKICEMPMAEKDAIFCYGMSKMTVSNEVDDLKRYETI